MWIVLIRENVTAGVSGRIDKRTEKRLEMMTQMNYEGSTHPMSRLRKGAKKRSCREQGASCERAENGPNTECERQATEHVGKRELPEERQLGVDVGIQRPKDGDVARPHR